MSVRANPLSNLWFWFGFFAIAFIAHMVNQ